MLRRTIPGQVDERYLTKLAPKRVLTTSDIRLSSKEGRPPLQTKFAMAMVVA